MEELKKWFDCRSSQAFLSMVLVQVFTTGLQLLSKIILSEGSSIFAVLTYRHLVGALCVAPFAFFLEGAKGWKLSWLAFIWLCINALTGIIVGLGLFYYGLKDTTATYSTNFLNLIPTVTFLFSVLLRLEKLGLKSRAGKIKSMGAVFCLAGAMVISLYKGEAFHLGHQAHHLITTVKSTKPNWTRGSIFLSASCFSFASWYIVQVQLFKEFSLRYWATMLTCIIGSIQAAVIGLCLDRSKASWKLGWDLQLVTILYSGTLCTAATFCLTLWAVTVRGPTYPPMFNPLSLSFVTVFEALLLGANIRLGTLLGTALIIVGLYMFLWGREKESKGMAPSNAAGEVTIIPESAGMQLHPTVTLSDSRRNSVVHVDELVGKTRREV